jgi:hypothetical protein
MCRADTVFAAPARGRLFLFVKGAKMAFSLRNLSVLAYANGFTLWHYKADPADHLHAGMQDFFAEAGDMLAGGDMLMVSSREGARLLCVLADADGLRTAAMM